MVPLGFLQKVAHYLHEVLALFPERCVTRPLKGIFLSSHNVLDEGFHHEVLGQVRGTVYDQRWGLDEAQAVYD